MNIYSKVITLYSKSIFQNTNENSEKEEKYDFFLITSSESKEENILITRKILLEEFSLLKAFITSSKKILSLYKDPRYSEKKKLETILLVFPGLSLSMKSFLRILVERNHLFLIPEIADEFQILVLKNEKILKVNLFIASPLRKKFGSKLLKSLRTLTQAKEIILKVIYEPKILGGAIVEYNFLSIDASIVKEFSLFFSEN